MKVKYFAWFETKHEKTEFIKLLNGCKTDIDALNQVLNAYPNITVSEAKGVIENFKQEINKK